MTVDEAKMCLRLGKRIFYKDIEFVRIKSLNFRKDNGKFSIFAELLDKSRNSNCIVPIEFLSLENTKSQLDEPEYKKVSKNIEFLKRSFINLLNISEDMNLQKLKKNTQKTMKILLELENEIDVLIGDKNVKK